MLAALAKFLGILRTYYNLKNAASPDVLKFLAIGSAAANAGEAFRTQLEEGTTLIQQLVDENRAMTPEEDAVLSQRIEDRLAHIASLNLDNPGGAERQP